MSIMQNTEDKGVEIDKSPPPIDAQPLINAHSRTMLKKINAWTSIGVCTVVYVMHVKRTISVTTIYQGK